MSGSGDMANMTGTRSSLPSYRAALAGMVGHLSPAGLPAPEGSRASVVNILEFRLGRVPRRVLLDRVFPGSELVSRDDDQTRLLEPAGDHRPVPAVTVTIHRVLALDRVAIEPADYPGSPRRAIQCPAHGVDTPGADVESR